MKLGGWGVAAPLVATLLAACLGSEPADGAGSGLPEGTGALPGAFAIVATECLWSSEAFAVPAAAVEPHVPDGYALATLLPGTANVGLHALECDHLVLGNTSVVNAATLAFVTVVVLVDEDRFGGGFYDYYLLEAWTTDNATRDTWQGHGVSSLPAVRIQRDAQAGYAQVSLVGEADEFYAMYEVPGEQDGTVSYDDAYRFHYLADDARWITVTGRSVFERSPRPVSLLATGGILGGLFGAELSSAAGTSSLGRGTFEWSFDSLGGLEPSSS